MLSFLKKNKEILFPCLSFFLISLFLYHIFSNFHLSIFFGLSSILLFISIFFEVSNSFARKILKKFHFLLTTIITNLSLIVIFYFIIIPYSLIYKLKNKFSGLNSGWIKSKTNIYNVLNLYD